MFKTLWIKIKWKFNYLITLKNQLLSIQNYRKLNINKKILIQFQKTKDFMLMMSF